MAIGEGTFSLVVGGLPISVFSRLLPSALTPARHCVGAAVFVAALAVPLSDPALVVALMIGVRGAA
jgi:hypothetical protein